MCSICSSFFTNPDAPHTEEKCPIRLSRYCNTCAKYGHLTKACPAKPSTRYTQPIFKEQMEIHDTILTDNVMPTPIDGQIYCFSPAPKLLIIKKDEEKEYCNKNGIKLTKKSALNVVLDTHAELMGKRLVYSK